MPEYRYECPRCKTALETYCSIKDHVSNPACIRCDAPMNQILEPALAIIGDITPYVATTGDQMGKVIGSRQEHKAFLKRNKLVEVGNEPIRDTSKMRKTVTRKEIREELRKVVPQVMQQARNRKRA